MHSRYAVAAPARPRLTDAVEKGFISFECARLIQDQPPMRNLDSKIHSPPFYLLRILNLQLVRDNFFDSVDQERTLRDHELRVCNLSAIDLATSRAEERVIPAAFIPSPSCAHRFESNNWSVGSAAICCSMAAVRMRSGDCPWPRQRRSWRRG
jgi:hypothetical protein